MADMFVYTLVENLKELMRSKHPIIGSKRNQATLGFLHKNVSVMNNFLKRTELEKCSADEEVKLLLTDIRDVTYEVENYVDSFVQEAMVAAREHADAINRIRQQLSSSTWKTIWKNQLTLQFLNTNENVEKINELLTEKCSAGDDDEKINELLMEIIDVTHQVENYVDSCCEEAIVTAREFRPRSDPNWSSWKMLRKLIEAVKIGVDHMNAKLDQSKKTVMATSYRSADDGRKRMKIEDSETVVGIEETMVKLLSGLTDGSKSMEVISIVGSPGIGKSTVAQRVFDHGRIKSSFPIRAWSTVSQTYDCKRLLIDILQSSSLFEDGDGNYSVDELGEELLKRFKGKRYLVVLDDVWGIEPWNDIQRSFPDQHNGSRVLFTSRFAAIGKDVSDDINTHYMSGLSEEHSWNLLKNKVFGDKGQCPPELVGSGMEMVRKCDGLPLAIVVIGGLLARKDKKPEFWEQVASNLAPALAIDQEASFMNTLELSYRHLPVHLKACFLYLGSLFPRLFISMRKLTWLLIAEGFVIQGTEEKSLEATAEGYINELVEWSLVTVSRKGSCGGIKAVRIHDLLRDFCEIRGMQEKFICYLKQYPSDTEHFKQYSSSGWERVLGWESILKQQRRLHIQAMSYPFHDRPSNVRSLFGFTEKHYEDTPGVFAQNFRLLKVLHLSHYSYCSCLLELENLVHLRYFSFGVISQPGFGNLRFSITKLLNLETLFIDAGEVFHLPRDVWNMVKLRHLYNKNGRFHFQTYPPQGAGLGSLQTIHTLCACDCCLYALRSTPNIRKLGLSRARSGTVLNLSFLKQLETLKVIGSALSITLKSLKLPTSVRKLTLHNTFLNWDKISCLEQLQNLEVLKLLENAFADKNVDADWYSRSYWARLESASLTSSMERHMEAYWDTSEVDFPKLKYLKIQGLDIVKWEDQSVQFESLEVLVLEKCRRLETIPVDLALCPSLHTVEVSGCTNLVRKLALEIEVEHENMYGNSNLQVFITDLYGNMYDEPDDSEEHDESDDCEEHDES